MDSNLPSQEAMQTLLDDTIVEHMTPGASIALSYDGKTVSAQAGVLSVDTQYPVRPDTLFQIGSVNKVLTATLMMILYDQGSVDLDAPVRRYIPDFRVQSTAASQAITVQQLLCHASGMGGDFFSDTGSGDDRLARYVDRCALLPLAHPVGDGFSYSNSAYNTAGRVIEVVSGLPYDRAMERLLFEPMALENASCDAYAIAGRSVAAGHGASPEHPADRSQMQRVPSLYTLPPSGSPAGSTTVMSAEDLLHFGRMHLNGGVADNGVRILSETAVKKMQEEYNHIPVPPRDISDWGLGWFILKPEGGVLLGHDGATIGQSAYLRLHPPTNTVAVVLANGEGVNDFAADMFANTIDVRTGLAPSPAPTPVSDEGIDLGLYEGVFESMMGQTRLYREKNVLMREGEIHLGDTVIEDPARPLSYAGDNHFLMYKPPAKYPALLSFLEPDKRGVPQVLFTGLRVWRRIA